MWNCATQSMYSLRLDSRQGWIDKFVRTVNCCRNKKEKQQNNVHCREGEQWLTIVWEAQNQTVSQVPHRPQTRFDCPLPRDFCSPVTIVPTCLPSCYLTSMPLQLWLRLMPTQLTSWWSLFHTPFHIPFQLSNIPTFQHRMHRIHDRIPVPHAFHDFIARIHASHANGMMASMHGHGACTSSEFESGRHFDFQFRHWTILY